MLLWNRPSILTQSRHVFLNSFDVCLTEQKNRRLYTGECSSNLCMLWNIILNPNYIINTSHGSKSYLTYQVCSNWVNFSLRLLLLTDSEVNTLTSASQIFTDIHIFWMLWCWYVFFGVFFVLLGQICSAMQVSGRLTYQVCWLRCVTPESNYECRTTCQLLPPANLGLTKWIELHTHTKIQNTLTVFWISSMGCCFAVEFAFIIITWS